MWLAPTIGDNGATEVSPRITTFYDPIGANHWRHWCQPHYWQYSFAHWRPIIQAPLDWRQYTKLLALPIGACERCVLSDTICLWKESYDVMKLRDYCFPKLSGKNMAHYSRYIFLTMTVIL